MSCWLLWQLVVVSVYYLRFIVFFCTVRIKYDWLIDSPGQRRFEFRRQFWERERVVLWYVGRGICKNCAGNLKQRWLLAENGGGLQRKENWWNKLRIIRNRIWCIFVLTNLTSGSNNFSDFSIGATSLRLHFWPYVRFFCSSKGDDPSGPMVNTPMDLSMMPDQLVGECHGRELNLRPRDHNVQRSTVIPPQHRQQRRVKRRVCCLRRKTRSVGCSRRPNGRWSRWGWKKNASWECKFTLRHRYLSAEVAPSV